jgi:hypothetical protein
MNIEIEEGVYNYLDFRVMLICLGIGLLYENIFQVSLPYMGSVCMDILEKVGGGQLRGIYPGHV